MHLKTMLVFVRGLAHPFEDTSLVKCSSGLSIDCQISERRLVLCALRKSGFGEIVVVRGSQEKDSLTVAISTCR